MNTLILLLGGVSLITSLIALVKHCYDIKNDVIVCSSCPYSNSLYCWDCKRNYNTKSNRYNNKHMSK